MNLPQFSVRYPVTIAMLMLGITILGVISFNRLGTDLLPAIYNPRIVVEIQSGERSPQEMEHHLRPRPRAGHGHVQLGNRHGFRPARRAEENRRL
ncbi:efflux RND transporter permease subunit [candidate division KSB1 bacterium]|nr:efflux RND transporter permease subunit [candidate division KSB1 bacterium]